jgi:hypothetical protein
MFYIVLTIRIKTLHQKSAIIINNNNSRKKEGKTHRLDRVILFISMERPNTSGRVEHKYSNPLTLQKIKSKTSVVEMKNLDKKH